MIEDLLHELSSSGWTISWAYQFRPGHWRMSIINEIDVGEEQGTYISHCASAPSFAEALEDCMSKMAEAEFEPDHKQTFAAAPSTPSLLEALGSFLRPASNIKRRV